MTEKKAEEQHWTEKASSNIEYYLDTEEGRKQLSEMIKKETDFIFVERIEEVFKHALREPDESQKGIEEILRRELGKMAKMERRKGSKSKKPRRKVAKKR